MLSKAEELRLGSNVTLSMPALERAQARLKEVIQHLNQKNNPLSSSPWDPGEFLREKSVE
jgi:hypothetical protein